MGLSRNEDILQAILDKQVYDTKPESRIEALLIAVAELIKLGGFTPADVQSYVNAYLDAHPEMVAGVDETQLNNALKEVFS